MHPLRLLPGVQLVSNQLQQGFEVIAVRVHNLLVVILLDIADGTVGQDAVRIGIIVRALLVQRAENTQFSSIN